MIAATTEPIPKREPKEHYIVLRWADNHMTYKGRNEWAAATAWEPGTVLGHHENEALAWEMVLYLAERARASEPRWQRHLARVMGDRQCKR